MEEKKGEKPTPQPLKTSKPTFPCNSRNNLLKSYCTHPPPLPLRALQKGPLSSPFLKVFHLFRKGGNRFGHEKSLGRKKEIYTQSSFSSLQIFTITLSHPISSHLIQLSKGKNLN
jgi:hypothetical protein